MTWLKPFVHLIFLINLMNSCHGKKPVILNIIEKLDPRLQSVKFWVDIFFPSLFEDDSTAKIISEIQGLSSELAKMRVHFDEKLDQMIKTIPARVRADSKVDESVRALENEINYIDHLYDVLLARFLNKPDDFGVQNELVDKVLSPSKDVSASVNNMYRVIVKDRTLALSDDFLTQLVNQLKFINSERCDDTVSPHSWFFEVYRNILITEIRGYVLNIMAYSVKSEIKKISYNYTMSSLTNELSTRLGNYSTVIRPKLATLPRDMKRCDPPQHIRGKTFIELVKVIQPIIVNEDQFGTDNQCNRCTTTKKIHGKDLIRRQGKDYPLYRACDGTVFGCLNYGFIFFGNPEVCLLPENSAKRYEWIKAPGKSKVYGNTNKCSGEIKRLRSHDYDGPAFQLSWSQGSWIYCPYCLCFCTEQDRHRSLRAINIRETYTNLAENMVAVGMRIVEQKRLLHIQVKQGKLLPGGRIDPNSVSWIPLMDMDYPNDKKVTVTNGQNKTETLVDFIDYVLIDKYGLNFVLDEMMADKYTIICGVRFNAFSSVSVRAVNVLIGTASFNWTTGQIDKNCQWKTFDSSKTIRAARQNPRSVVQAMQNLDDPTRARNNKQILKDKIVTFSMSSMSKDAGQSMVPFFDSLPVETIPASPLGGIGFFHKSAPGFGGFISPIIFTLNMTDYINFGKVN